MSLVPDDLYQDLVLEHKRAPRHFGELAAPTHEAQGRNPQCGDEVRVQLRIEDDRVRDIGFSGQGCAICVASTSMMTEVMLGKEVEAARALQERFRAVLTGQAEPGEMPAGKLESLAGVRNYPSRVKCALLGWHALMHALAQPVAPSPAVQEREP
ncbi:SUF system NifU family Fe-S cluster assembly protein [Ramlibacter sp. USB13]|uniref:SUF system NifU family Fe-S cluster assembly protein n=1 Tax=Ramlibacter cellulosilyticus TaxID=2764187 RepID=A0A923MT14_9BURK|nr:SUF system NifU family Fe-S cluster assembly protein [Ramlibacter cellulosilyticus]MBC5784703.1 SUF system NifU family Fe-S cluster assembly protein [Ramlibacter cellulosilyticus]